jgi:DNA-binding transcriptional LysR family regulator
LRIGAFPTALAGFVPAAIARLRLRHPDTRVAVDEGTDDLPARVRSGELHLAVGFQETTGPRQEPPGLERRDLLRERFMVALAPDHRLAGRSEVHLADLSDEDWTVALTDGLIVRACRAAGFEPNLVSITRDQLAIRALILRGLAVTLVPQLLADPFKDLALRPMAGAGPTRDIYVLLPPGGRHPLVAPALDALTTTAAELQGSAER